MTTPKNVVRKYEPFKEFQKFLVSETSVGNISRQEHVSMIPPLLLDVKPEHAVLDLCAAPGSKSAQLIEAIHAGEEERVERAIKVAKGEMGTNGVGLHEHTTQDHGRTTGLLVANDVNYQRAQMLVHQVKRLNSPNLIVTNHDATMFPSIALPSSEPTTGQVKRGKYLKFDRILADVPCSGDGTCRKNPSIWKDWTPQNGLGLYITQVRILTRALQLLKAGGRVVYSTCSMNPVENEAVVSSAIERCGGVSKVRLLDMSDHLPSLLRNSGLDDWSVMARSGKIFESWPEAQQYEDEETSKIVPGMFAPGAEENILLKHCMRVYPHQQDTGGFFIAVLEKLSEIRAKPESESKCMNRDWTFVKPEEPAATAGVVSHEHLKPSLLSGLLDEIEHPHAPVQTAGDFTSAAARQNEDVELEDPPSALGKRKGIEEDSGDSEAAAKRLKAEYEDGNTSIEFDRSTRPLPPSVQLGIEATEANGHIEDSPGPDRSELQPPQRKRRRDNEPANEEAFKYISSHHPELATICAFYELHPAFPRDRFLVRNPAGDPVKGIYYSSQLVKDILQANEGRGMKFVHGGVKMFMKQDVQGQEGVCRWRIQTEGLPIVQGWVGEDRAVRLYKRSTLRKLLVEMFPKIGAEDSPEGEGWKALGEIGERVLKIGMGCCVLRVMASNDEDGFEEGFTLPLWRSLHSLNLMLPKDERKAMLLRIFEEDVELINHHEMRKNDQANKADGNRMKGSASAEDDAKELQRRLENAPDDDGGVLLDAPSPLEPELALAAEQNALAEEDTERAKELEELEDDDRKIRDAMPEREGEGDEMNTTI
jgi:multisite-specific tRNA:(cytosine-C5)-methyltransferase